MVMLGKEGSSRLKKGRIALAQVFLGKNKKKKNAFITEMALTRGECSLEMAFFGLYLLGDLFWEWCSLRVKRAIELKNMIRNTNGLPCS